MKSILVIAFLIILTGNALAQAPISSKPTLLTFATNLQTYLESKTDSSCKFEEPYVFCSLIPVKRTTSKANKICTITETLKITITANCGDGTKEMMLGWEVQDGQPVVSIDGEEISVEGENLPSPITPLSAYLKATQLKNNPWFPWAYRIAKEHLDLKEKE